MLSAWCPRIFKIRIWRGVSFDGPIWQIKYTWRWAVLSDQHSWAMDHHFPNFRTGQSVIDTIRCHASRLLEFGKPEGELSLNKTHWKFDFTKTMGSECGTGKDVLNSSIFKYGNFGLSPSMSILDFKNSRSTFFAGRRFKAEPGFQTASHGARWWVFFRCFLGLLKDATVGPSMHR